MRVQAFPGRSLRGQISLPGDKSISHRAALFAGMASGESQIENFLDAGVTRVMLNALKQLGVSCHLDKHQLTVNSPGFSQFKTPARALDCGNSGTTMRLMSGALAAANLDAVLDGSDGLRQRPMNRIIKPLAEMGVSIQGAQNGSAPLILKSRLRIAKLRGITHYLSVASAQVKSAILLAALAADGPTTIFEPGPSRDHTERMLAGFGIEIECSENGQGVCVQISPLPELVLPSFEMTVPGDISSAAFLIVAALLIPGSELTLTNLGLNSTRTGLLDVLLKMGAKITISKRGKNAGEPVGDLYIVHSKLHGTQISGDIVVRMIDEFPIFSIAAAMAQGFTKVEGAGELRYKETDRISILTNQLKKIGVLIEETKDGFVIQGRETIQGGKVDASGDHRLAMALIVAGLNSKQGVVVENAEIIYESFPGFLQILQRLGTKIEVIDS